MLKDNQKVDQFIIKKLIASGGAGDVYLAEDAFAGRAVVLKFLQLPRENDEAGYRRAVLQFKKEYKILSSARHPNIATVYSFGHLENQFYYATEYIEGTHIYNALLGKSFNEQEELYIQLFDGLDYLHRQGILHLDIKPSNVLVTLDGGKQRVKLVDFGLATLISEYKEIPGGSVDYAAPETVLGWKERIDGRADLFSAGVLMYQCTVGVLPFTRHGAKNDFEKLKSIVEKEGPPPDPLEWSRDMPEHLVNIIMRLITKEPEKRFYMNARAVMNAVITRSPDKFGSVTDSFESYLTPSGNKLIGNEGARVVLRDAVESLGGNREHSVPGYLKPVIWITGRKGLGKSCFLRNAKLWGEEKVEDVALSQICFPAEDAHIAAWKEDLNRKLERNDKSILVLVDNAHEVAGTETADFLSRIADHALRRSNEPLLYGGILPVLIVLTSDESSDGGLIKKSAFSSLKSEDIMRFDLKPFTPKELHEYLKATPALKDQHIPKKWLDNLYYQTSGTPGEIREYLAQLDVKKTLFDPAGNLVVEAIAEPSAAMERDHAPKSTRERLQREYDELSHIEKDILKFISVWSWKEITHHATYDDIANFLYNPALALNLRSLTQKRMLANQKIKTAITNWNEARPDVLDDEETLREEERTAYKFLNSYFPVMIHKQIAAEEREQTHDQIALYLRSNQDAVMLHRGYGSDKNKSRRSLISLGRKMLYQKGKAKLAIALFDDALKQCKIDQAKLQAYILSLLMDAFYYHGNHQDVKSAFKKSLDIFTHGVSGENYWNLRAHNKIIPSLLAGGEYSEAGEIIKSGKKLCKKIKSNIRVSKIILENYEARISYEKSYHEAKKRNKLLLESKKLYEKQRENEALLSGNSRALIYNNDLGLVFRALGEYDKALKYLLIKHEKLGGVKNIYGEIDTAYALSETYRMMKDYSSAERFALQSLALAERLANSRWLVFANHVLLNVHHGADKFDKALEAANRALAASVTLRDQSERDLTMRRLWVGMGHCHKELRQYERALLFFQAAIKPPGGDLVAMSANVGLGEVYYYKKDYSNAAKHLTIAEDLLDETPDPSHGARVTELKKLIDGNKGSNKK